jgi:hypothetical protein
VGLYILLSLLGKGSVNTFPRQRIIDGGVIFCAVVVSKESRRLVLPRTSCTKICHSIHGERGADDLYQTRAPIPYIFPNAMFGIPAQGWKVTCDMFHLCIFHNTLTYSKIFFTSELSFTLFLLITETTFCYLLLGKSKVVFVLK